MSFGSLALTKGQQQQKQQKRTTSTRRNTTTTSFVTLLLGSAIMTSFLLSGGSRLTRSSTSVRLVAQAFTARPLTTTSTSQTSAGANAALLNQRRTASGAAAAVLTTTPSSQFRHQCLSTSTTTRRMVSTSSEVEEDLDAALEDILGGAISEAENPAFDDVVEAATAAAVPAAGNHMKGSRPMPSKLVEKDEVVDYSDPKFLSTSNKRWVEAGLAQGVIDVLSGKGITQFTPVQAEAFDPVLARRDVIGRSRTGTGKTLAFGMPALTRLVAFSEANGKRDPNTGRMLRGRKPSMLILCPTRELARQVAEEISQVAQPLGMFADVFHGGVSYDGQARALRQGIDVVVGTPGRIIDHLKRGNMDLSETDIVVLDEADEMLNMGFAEDVEVILKGLGSANDDKAQCLLFSATTPPWVKDIGRNYQKDVLHIDSTNDGGGSRVATTVRHMAVQLPPGTDAKKSILEDIIAVEISRDAYDSDDEDSDDDEDEEELVNHLAVAAAARKKKGAHAMQQKIFGKTIVFTNTKREADDLASGAVFKSLSAQALHGDVSQSQRDSTLNAFRAGAFNVLVATDVAARGIDIQDVDLVVQFDPPRDVDSYVHRSGRTGRAGKKGVSVLLFNPNQARDIVKIERSLAHGFKFDLVGPPSIEAALRAAARTSAIASKGVPDETSVFFRDAAASLLAEGNDPNDVVARCLAAISRRSTEVRSRSLITGQLGMTTVEMVNSQGKPVGPNDVMFTVSKLARMSNQAGTLSFKSDVGKIRANRETGTAIFDMDMNDAKRLVEFSADVDAGGNVFSLLKELEIERGSNFGRQLGRPSGGGGRFYRDNRGGGGRGRNDSRGRYGGDRGGRSGGGDQRRSGERPSFNNYHGQNRRANHEGRSRSNDGARGGYRGRYDNSSSNRGGGGGGGGGGSSGWSDGW